MKEKNKNVKKRTFENVKNYWNSQANRYGNLPCVTIRDLFFRIHELAVLLSLIPQGSSILDVGCGNGFGTLILNKRASYTLGIDYSEKMIEWARRLLTDSVYSINLFSQFRCFYEPEISHIDFKVANVLEALPTKQRFDVISSQRTLINLLDHKHQIKALKNLRNYAHSSSLLLLTEATLQGHEKTDAFRAMFGLPKLEKYWRNCYIDEKKLKDWERVGWRVENILTFDTYMLLSKIIYPAAYGQENCKFLSGANHAAMEVTNLFRTKKAVDEIDLKRILDLYLLKVRKYDVSEYKAIKNWIDRNFEQISNCDWEGLGHQKLFICIPE